MSTSEAKRGGVTLGKYLSSVRIDRQLTLRQVEEATGREISNAYLSQIENDKIKKPSPNILFTLANLYGVDFNKLMEMAGYITSERRPEERHGRATTFADMNLSPEEEAELLRYLRFIRQKDSS
jgi:transcriptional regulator with XRE-family HTH domain